MQRRALRQARDQVTALRTSLAETDAWARRLEGELALQTREHAVEREGCAQVFRHLRRQARELERHLAAATAQAIDLASSRQHVIADLALERSERRRAVLFIADRDLLDVYAEADAAPETIASMRGVGPTSAQATVDALAPTERPEALGAGLVPLAPPAIRERGVRS